jgi:hypothetical protein
MICLWFPPPPIKQWPPRYSWNTVERDTKQHYRNPNPLICVSFLILNFYTYRACLILWYILVENKIICKLNTFVWFVDDTILVPCDIYCIRIRFDNCTLDGNCITLVDCYCHRCYSNNWLTNHIYCYLPFGVQGPISEMTSDCTYTNIQLCNIYIYNNIYLVAQCWILISNEDCRLPMATSGFLPFCVQGPISERTTDCTCTNIHLCNTCIYLYNLVA